MLSRSRSARSCSGPFTIRATASAGVRRSVFSSRARGAPNPARRHRCAAASRSQGSARVDLPLLLPPGIQVDLLYFLIDPSDGSVSANTLVIAFDS